MDGPILVTGATGTLGRPLVARLLAAGAPVRVMSRGPRPDGDDRPYEWVVCDLTTGVGLDAAVAGAGTIAHCATNARNDVAATRRLLDAARAAGRPHVVYVSIAGIEKIPYSYYKSKLEAEAMVEESGLPWTIQRATQFHDLVAAMTTAQRRLPAVLVPSGFRFQPVEAAEVAGRLAELARGAAAGRVPDFGGPEVRDARDLAGAVLRAAGRRRRLVPLPVPGRVGRGFRAGGNLVPERSEGTVTFEEYLAARAAAGERV